MENCCENIKDEGSQVSSCCCKLLLDIGDNHEPPIGFGEGSSFLDIPNILTLGNPNATGDGYQTYKFLRASGEPYTNISKITVLTEGGPMNRVERLRGGVSFCTYEFTAERNVKLRLWLSETKQAPQTTADVIISGNAGGSIKAKQMLGNRLRSEKVFRTYRHKYPDPGSSTNPDFRYCFCVVKWDVIDVSGNPVVFNGNLLGEVSDDFYYFYITFDHIHEEHE